MQTCICIYMYTHANVYARKWQAHTVKCAYVSTESTHTYKHTRICMFIYIHTYTHVIKQTSIYTHQKLFTEKNKINRINPKNKKKRTTHSVTCLSELPNGV